MLVVVVVFVVVVFVARVVVFVAVVVVVVVFLAISGSRRLQSSPNMMKLEVSPAAMASDCKDSKDCGETARLQGFCCA